MWLFIVCVCFEFVFFAHGSLRFPLARNIFQSLPPRDYYPPLAPLSKTHTYIYTYVCVCVLL